MLTVLKSEGYRIELIFLESADEILVQRFSESRRQHPMAEGGSIREGIQKEREQLSILKAQADRIIDTSVLTVHELRALLESYFHQLSRRTMNITFLSFGFKNGVPHDVDMVLDVRFLPNPHFVRELKELDGSDPRVVEYVFRSPETQLYVDKLKDFLAFQLPLFEREGKTYLTIAVGCTGGRHRSIVIANYLGKVFSDGKYQVHITHRDIMKQ